MKKNVLKALKWLLLGVVCAVLTVIFFQLERGERRRRYSLTVGCGMLTVLCLAAAFWSLTGKMDGKPGALIVEDVFGMKSGGCVVVGRVQGALAAGQRVVVAAKDGTETETKIYAIEINRRRAKAAVDTPAALYLKEVEPSGIHKGDRVSSKAGDGD